MHYKISTIYVNSKHMLNTQLTAVSLLELSMLRLFKTRNCKLLSNKKLIQIMINANKYRKSRNINLMFSLRKINF